MLERDALVWHQGDTSAPALVPAGFWIRVEFFQLDGLSHYLSLCSWGILYFFVIHSTG